MAIILHRTSDEKVILYALEQMQQEWPDLGLFRWAHGNSLRTKAEWISENVRFWLVWEEGRFLGYMAATDTGRGRWIFHFAGRRVLAPSVFLDGWKTFRLEVLGPEGVRLVLAYIPPERAAIRRLARIFSFRRFSNTLWALDLTHQN